MSRSRSRSRSRSSSRSTRSSGSYYPLQSKASNFRGRGRGSRGRGRGRFPSFIIIYGQEILTYCVNDHLIDTTEVCCHVKALIIGLRSCLKQDVYLLMIIGTSNNEYQKHY